MMKKIVALFLLLLAWASPASATIAVTAAGNKNVTSASTITIDSTASGAANIPASSLIVVFVTDTSNSGPLHSVNDNAGNVYSLATSEALNNITSNGNGYIFYSNTGNAVALTGSGTITYTLNKPGGTASVSVIYITGTTGTLDTGVTATAFGTGNSPSASSGVSTVAGDIFLAFVSYDKTKTFSQDTGHGWAAPPTAISANDAGIGGGNQIVGSTSAKTFAPTLTGPGTPDWAMLFVAFKPFVAASSFIFTPAVIP